MKDPQIGVSIPALTPTKTFSREAEAAGFDYLTCGEHVAFHGPMPNAFVRLAAAAGATDRVGLVSAVTLLPLYPAALAAKMTAELDQVSGGRFHLGVGVGGEYPREFEACGVPLKQRGVRADEALEVITALLEGGTVTKKGRFNQLSKVALAPPPVRAPRPPIWIAGRTEAAMRRAARFGDAWMPYMYTPSRLRESVVDVARYAREAGRDPARIKTVVSVFTAVYSDGKKARSVANEYLSKTYGQDFTQIVARYGIGGTGDELRHQLGEFVDAGADTVLLLLACPGPDAFSMLEHIESSILNRRTDLVK